MFPLVTPAMVIQIVDVDPNVNLTPFITLADQLVQNQLVPIYGTNTPQALATLTLIEQLLAAHYYTVMRPRNISEMAEGVGQVFESKVHFGLQLSKYGQQALVMDGSGQLARINYANSNEGIPRTRIMWFGQRCRRNPPGGWPNGYMGSY
jgi:hypothetical protein